MKSFLSHEFYKFSRQLRVDLEGNGDHTSIKDACDEAATFARDTFNYILITVNAGAYYEEPFTVPSYVIVNGYGDVGEDTFPNTLAIRQGTQASETSFVTCSDQSVLSGITVLGGFGGLPANFSADYNIVNCVSNVDIVRCQVGLSGSYVGANIVSAVRLGSSSILRRSTVTTVGSSTVNVRGSAFGIYFSYLFGQPDIAVWNEGGDSAIHFSRLVGNPNVAGQRPISNVVQNDGTLLRLFSTRVPFNRRGGAGTYNDFHPTPKQLSIARKAAVRSITFANPAGDRQMDSYTDGTLYANSDGGAYSVILPPVANAIDGEIFAVTNTGTSGNNITTTADTTINGTTVITDGNSVSYQKVAGVWWAI